MIQINYLIYVLENQVPQSYLVQLFKDKDIFLDRETIRNIEQLQKFYQQITHIYHNPAKLKRFTKALKTPFVKDPDFFQFPQVFNDFYLLFKKLSSSRSQIIKYHLQIPDVDLLVIKYDQYFEGIVQNVFDVPENYQFEGLINGQLPLLHNYGTGELRFGDIESGKYTDDQVGIDILNNKVIVTLMYEIKQWDPQTNQFTILFESEGDEIIMSKISSNGILLIELENEFKILKDKQIIEIPQDIKRYGFLGHKVGLVSENGVYVWDDQIKELDIVPDVQMDHIFKEDRIIRYNSNLVDIYDLTGKLIFMFDHDDIIVYLVSDDLLMISQSGKKDIIDIKTGQLFTTFSSSGYPVLWLPGDQFAIAYDNRVEIIDKFGTIKYTIDEKNPQIKLEGNKLIIFNDSRVRIMM